VLYEGDWCIWFLFGISYWCGLDFDELVVLLNYYVFLFGCILLGLLLRGKVG